MDQQNKFEEMKLKNHQQKLNQKIEKISNYKPILITNGVNRIDGPSEKEVQARQFKLKVNFEPKHKNRDEAELIRIEPMQIKINTKINVDKSNELPDLLTRINKNL